MNEDLLIIRLRDCFTAGYTLPQFCIDNGIKKPLFVAIDERRADFLWEIFVQFKYDKRITPTFSLLNGKVGTLNFSVACILSEMKFESISNLNINEYDKIIFLNAERFNAQIPNAIYLDQLTDYFITRTYAEIPLLHFLQRHPKVNIVVTNYPILHLNEYSTEFEKRILKENIHQVHAKIEASNGKKIDTPLDFLGYTNEEVLELLDMTDAKTNPDGSTSLKNSASRLIGVDNGQRKTAYQPTNFQNKIYFMGTCTYFGIGTPFDKTLESYLQKIIIENNLPYRVENEGQFFSGRYQDIFYNLNNLPVVDGDIIFICLQALKTNGVPFFDVCSIFDRPHNYGEVFTDFDHLNEVGYKILAERFFQFLAQNNFFKNVDFHYPPPPPAPHRYGIPRENFSATKFFSNKELEVHKKKLRERRLKIGCIVMNANPFTLGHEYLVQYAAARVHKLFIMVVSEDKSEFTFADRFEMVKRGTEKFPNVEVLPSGQFVISQKTFSGYFNKENLQDVQVDSSQDVELFAAEIAPSLGINIRFVGEEPEDTVTRTYNENMKNILPRYDIDFCEIPRREIDGQVISAKSVRAALKVGDFDKLKRLVPATTLDCLREMN